MIIIGLTFSIVILILSFVFVLRQRKTYYKNKLAKKEHEKVRLKLELKNKELVTNALHLANRSELINDIIGKLQIIHDEGETETQKSITELIKQISFELPQEVWKEFETRFEGIHEAFLESLFSEYPELSPAEIKICSFLRLNMTSKDISRLTHRSLRTIENQRNSIRKKMNLSAESSLENHLMKIN